MPGRGTIMTSDPEEAGSGSTNSITPTTTGTAATTPTPGTTATAAATAATGNAASTNLGAPIEPPGPELSPQVPVGPIGGNGGGRVTTIGSTREQQASADDIIRMRHEEDLAELEAVVNRTYRPYRPTEDEDLRVPPNWVNDKNRDPNIGGALRGQFDVTPTEAAIRERARERRISHQTHRRELRERRNSNPPKFRNFR